MSDELEENLTSLVEFEPSWHVETVGDDISSILECYSIGDLEGCEKHGAGFDDSGESSIRLVPPPNTTNQEEDRTSSSCLVKLSCSNGSAFQTLLVDSDVRHIELYDLGNSAYIATLKGELIDTSHLTLNTPNNAPIVYQHQTTFKQAVRELEIKFICGKNRFQLVLKKIRLGLKQCEHGKITKESGLVPKPSIDMDSVKKMLSSKEFSLPDQANSLMSSIEQYQKNQTSALADIQGLMKSLPSSHSAPTSLSAASAAGLMGSMHLLGAKSAAGGTAGDSSNPALMMNLLQQVCSDVGKIRQDEWNKEKKAAMFVSSKQEEQQQQFKDDSNISRQIQEMESRLAAMIVESENRIISHVEARLSEMQVALVDNCVKQITAALVPDKTN